MMNKSFKVFLYITCWIAAWLLFSLIVNQGLIASNVYNEGEKGKLVTFFISGMISLAGATSLFKETFD